MEPFRALLLERGEDKATNARVASLSRDALMPGDTLVRVTHTTVNYKDALAITGRAPVVRRWPLVSGVDLAGIVVESASLAAGTEVVLNGSGAGELHHGGHAGYAQVPAAWLIPKPAGLSAAETMAIGTAGYTAMLSVIALERFGLRPAHGAVLVTGASGGVGSIAVALLAALGWHVVAVTGRPAEAEYLRLLGAAEILPRAELAGALKPLGTERWAAGIDSIGGPPLANALSMTRAGGAIAACGNAAGLDLPASVAPFILRGVSLLGINSVYQPREARLEAWSRLDRDLPRERLAAITETVGFDDIPRVAEAVLAGRQRGRVVVDLALTPPKA